MIAKGTFEVDLQPMDASLEGKQGVQFHRLSIHKIFQGDLEAVSRGEMLSAVTLVQGSAGYVALEQVEGTLAGQQGTFVLQHYGIAKQGEQHLILEVVPGSGTQHLQRLSGKMSITIENGHHQYEFDYVLK